MNKTNFGIYCFISILFLFESIKFINSEPLLNNVIRLGDEGFGYNHFSFNSNGDMIIDSEAYPVSNERRFFGLKKNGRFYFKDSNNKETPYYSINLKNYNKEIIERESFFIKISSNDSNVHGRELLCCISKNYIELYDLNNKNYTLYNTTNIFGNIYTNTFSVIKFPDQSNSYYYYTFGYLSNESNNIYLNIRKTYFSFDLSNGFKHEKTINYKEISLTKSISCFYTHKNKYICFSINNYNHLEIRVYNILQYLLVFSHPLVIATPLILEFIHLYPSLHQFYPYKILNQIGNHNLYNFLLILRKY